MGSSDVLPSPLGCRSSSSCVAAGAERDRAGVVGVGRRRHGGDVAGGCSPLVRAPRVVRCRDGAVSVPLASAVDSVDGRRRRGWLGLTTVKCTQHARRSRRQASISRPAVRRRGRRRRPADPHRHGDGHTCAVRAARPRRRGWRRSRGQSRRRRHARPRRRRAPRRRPPCGPDRRRRRRRPSRPIATTATTASTTTTSASGAAWPRSVAARRIAFLLPSDVDDGTERCDGDAGRRVAARASAHVVVGEDRGDRGDGLAVVEVHHPHAGGAATLRGDLAHRHADRDAARRHGDDLVVDADHERGDDLALACRSA